MIVGGLQGGAGPVDEWTLMDGFPKNFLSLYFVYKTPCFMASCCFLIG